MSGYQYYQDDLADKEVSELWARIATEHGRLHTQGKYKSENSLFISIEEWIKHDHPVPCCKCMQKVYYGIVDSYLNRNHNPEMYKARLCEVIQKMEKL